MEEEEWQQREEYDVPRSWEEAFSTQRSAFSPEAVKSFPPQMDADSRGFSRFERLVRSSIGGLRIYAATPQHFLYFFPEPQGQGSFRPILSPLRRTCCTGCASPAPAMRACSSSRRFLRRNSCSISSIEVARLAASPPLLAGATPGLAGSSTTCIR